MFGFCVLFVICFGFSWFIICLKWRINIKLRLWDWLQYFYDDFGTSRKITKHRPFYTFCHVEVLQKYKRNMGISLNLLFCISQHSGFPKCWQFWKRSAPTNDEHPFNKFLEILDMRSISIKNMKWKFGNRAKELRSVWQIDISTSWAFFIFWDFRTFEVSGF